MNTTIFFKQRIFWIVLAALYSSAACAGPDRPELPDADDSGLTILNNATNVTHWGLGAGAGIESAPYKNYGTKFTPIPLFYFDNKWIHAFGTELDVKVGKWAGVNLALRGSYAVGDGYKGSDAAILNGMQDRNGAFWYGPVLSWSTAYGTLSGSFLEGGNKGQQAEIGFFKEFEYGRFTLAPHAGIEWLSNKYVDYYYGVRPSEARAGRPEYTGRSTWNESVGARIDYRLTAHQGLLLDVGVSHLGAGTTDSPLVGKRYVPQVKVAYLYRFR
ncbi:outer membrane protein [Paraburkholderia silvatlantica]|uniref:Outer membrane protein n=1 Tax=Paraburkholderia silvatlantica TaxID=321895 RepID=A0A2V4UIP0_9BURK|nr:MipA/OmpV family protein [Paraburkholderia silvatlantica]PYE19703.1 outer membrane protein [Paraburkholderia silvatlantica]